jgi:HK97 family phage portal protein
MAKRPTKRPSKARNAPVAAVYGSSLVRRTDLLTSTTNPTDVRNNALMMRATTGTVAHAIALNAAACAAQTLRLFRPASAGGGKAVSKRVKSYLSTISRKARETIGEDDIVEVEDHPALTLIRQPDPMTSATDWVLTAYTHVEACGSTYWRWVRDGSEPVALVINPPQFVRVIPDAQTFIAGYVVGRQAPGETIPPEDMIWVKYRPDPYNPLHGWTWAQTVTMLADLEMAALTAEVNRWHNGGQPSMVFEADAGTEEAIANRKEEMMRDVRGTVNAGNPLILTGMKLIPGGVSPKDMEYAAGLGIVRERIYAAAGIPDTVWKVGDSNRASATVGHPQWLGQTIAPKINTFAEQLTANVLSQYEGTDGWFFAYDNPVQEDQDAEHKRVADMAGRGAATVNEVRGTNGYEPVDGGDVLPLEPSKAAELRTLVVEVASKRMPRESGLALAGLIAPGVDPMKLAAMFPEPVAPVVPAPVPEPDPDPTAIKRARMRAHWKANRRTVEKAINPDIAALFQTALGRNIAAALSAGLKPDGTIDDAALERVLDGMADRMGDLFKASVNSTLEDLGESLSVGDDAVAAWIEQRGLELSTSVPDTIKQQVANQLAELTASGEVSVAEAVTKIRESVPDIAASRAEAIARTETSLAYNHGRVEAFEEAGIEKRWWLPAGGPCPICDALAAKYPQGNGVAKGEMFEVVVNGKLTSVKAPAAHPNCQCSVEPEL